MPYSRDDTKITLKHSSGSAAEVHFYGATVTSWNSLPMTNDSPPSERLFLSEKAHLDGSKAIRGGIPICFPIFGPPPKGGPYKDLPQHGYARTSTWAWSGILLDSDDGVSVKLTLDAPPSFPPATLAYTVTLTAHQLSTTLHVSNPSSSFPLPFQALLHTYLLLPPHSSAAKVGVRGLAGVEYTDKVRGGARDKEHREVVSVETETDRVYVGAPDDIWVGYLGQGKGEPGGGVDVRKKNLPDVTVWNPQADAGSKMADLHAGGWERFVCVEPGVASKFEEVAPGKEWIGFQVLTAY